MEIKACIFDLDGVITDTAESHFKAWLKVATDLGVPFDKESNEKLKGVGRKESLKKILSWGGVELTESRMDEVMNEKNELYKEYIKELTAADVYAGVDPFLRELRDQGVKIGLGSASRNARTIIDRLEITHFFDVIIDGNSVEKTKPDPQVFTKGAEAMGVDPTSTVVFEDAESGIEAARNGGFRVIGVGRSESLNIADHVIPGFADFSLTRLKSMYNV